MLDVKWGLIQLSASGHSGSNIFNDGVRDEIWPKYDKFQTKILKINPLNAELNPICHLLALLTFKNLASYI